jgi:hypothetical protein
VNEMGEENILSKESAADLSRFFTPPRKSEVPWDRRPPYLLAMAVLSLAIVAVVIITGRQLGDRPILAAALFFVFGLGVGLITLRPMTRYIAAHWPWQKLRQEFTGNRFWTLQAPTFSPAYLRKVRELKTELARQGKSTETVKLYTILLLFILVLLIGWQIKSLVVPFLAFLGWGLTGLELPLYLWWRSLPE